MRKNVNTVLGPMVGPDSRVSVNPWRGSGGYCPHRDKSPGHFNEWCLIGPFPRGLGRTRPQGTSVKSEVTRGA